MSIIRAVILGGIGGLWLSAQAAAGTASVDLEALLGNTAVLTINGQRHTLRVGQSQDGVTLVATQATTATLDIDGRAQTIGRTEGVTKLIFDSQTDRVLGVGICGAGAGELIAEGVLAVETAALARDVAESIHAHPTLSETIMESAEAAYDQATHFYRPKKK